MCKLKLFENCSRKQIPEAQQPNKKVHFLSGVGPKQNIREKEGLGAVRGTDHRPEGLGVKVHWARCVTSIVAAEENVIFIFKPCILKEARVEMTRQLDLLENNVAKEENKIKDRQSKCGKILMVVETR